MRNIKSICVSILTLFDIWTSKEGRRSLFPTENICYPNYKRQFEEVLMTPILTQSVNIKSSKTNKVFMNKFNVSNFVENIFDCYGRFLSRHPWPFIIVPLIITFVLSFGICRITINDDLRFLYTQPGSPSLHEFHVHQTFHNLTEEPMTYVNIAFISLHRDNVLEKNYSDTFLAINSFIMNNLTINIGGRKLNFGEHFCRQYSYCKNSNRPLNLFLEFYFNPKIRNRTEIKFTYPVMIMFNAKIFLPGNLYGVTMDQNGTVEQVSLVSMTFKYSKSSSYGLHFDDTVVQNAVETGMENYLDSLLVNSGLKHSIYSMNKLKNEIAKNTWSTLIYLPMSVFLLIIFTIATTCTTDSVTSKPIEGLIGVFTSVLAIISAGGLLMLFGIPYNSTVSVMPFLTLALAVDDTYIILAAWHFTDRNQRSENRMGTALREAGAAITVTALTDVFSFAIGAFSSTPAISAFCQFTAAAVAFDYIYQLTFFCAITSLSGRREEQGKHFIFFWLPANKFQLCNFGKNSEKFRLNPAERIFKLIYSKIIFKRGLQIGVIVMYVFYLCFCLYGCLFIKVNLTPSKILMKDSPLNHHISLAENYIWKQGLIGMIYVSKCPDFRIPDERKRFSEFVEKLESTSYSMGKNSTLLWFREFERYIRFFEHDDEKYFEDLYKYTTFSANHMWAEQIHWSKSETCENCTINVINDTIKDFHFTSGYHILDWLDRRKLVKTWRDICSDEKFRHFDAVVYDENNFFADQMNSLAPNTIQDCGIAFFCMAFVCGIFITNWIVLFWVLWSLFSMNLAVIGLLAWWNCDLDPSSVTSILMSIGLTVDFTAHVGYHFSRCKKETRAEKLQETLIVAGWPLVQGAISTLLAIFGLVFVKSYAVQVFFRTVLLVILSGLLHALLFLPVLFLCTVRDEKKKK